MHELMLRKHAYFNLLKTILWLFCRSSIMPSMFQKNLLLAASTLLFFLSRTAAQQITGVWEGKINNNKVEVKIIQKGDSLTGTSHYYSATGNYRRYSIKGYFDPETNEVVWWDDQLIEGRDGRTVLRAGLLPMMSRADFNCPGGGKMMLDSKSTHKEEERGTGTVYLEKSYSAPLFTDEWDYVIDNYTTGANDPDVIDSIGLLARIPAPIAPPPPVLTQTIPEIKEEPKPVITEEPKPVRREAEIITHEPQRKSPPTQTPGPAPVSKPITIEEKLIARQKLFTKEILVEGDSVELRFYDNAQVDGDSISLFLNNRLLFTHVRLTDKPYTIKLPVTDLNESNELIMVAENLGSIPPNTSYMVAIVGEARYDAYLTSTEHSSAMIRLRKK